MLQTGCSCYIFVCVLRVIGFVLFLNVFFSLTLFSIQRTRVLAKSLLIYYATFFSSTKMSGIWRLTHFATLILGSQHFWPRDWNHGNRTNADLLQNILCCYVYFYIPIMFYTPSFKKVLVSDFLKIGVVAYFCCLVYRYIRCLEKIAKYMLLSRKDIRIFVA